LADDLGGAPSQASSAFFREWLALPNPWPRADGAARRQRAGLGLGARHAEAACRRRQDARARHWGGERIASFPDLLTFRELGYRDVEF